jgi:predicted dehydrogenase
VVDKPFTTSVAEAVELFHIAKKKQRLLTVYHNRRFDADFQAARDMVRAQVLGRIVRFESHYDRYRPSSKVGAWREKPGPGSGVLFDLAPHLIDHALALFGRPESVFADIRIERAGFSTNDAFDVTLRYAGGLRAELKATMLCATPRPRMILLGEKGSYVKREFDPLENSLRNGAVPQGESWVLEKEENWGELTIAEDGTMRTSKVASKGDWREFYANVRDALLGKAPLMITPQQAVDVMVTLELAAESNSRGCAVPWRDVLV